MTMKPRKTRVALLVGGPSSEHDVSLASGRVVHANLDKNKYEVVPVLVSRKGEWPIEPKHLKDMIDVAFIAMHGEYGEDGTVQELLEDLDVPYTGSDFMASALAMNKILAQRLLKSHGILVPSSTVVASHEVADLDHASIYLPAVVKPADKGSSVGVSIVRDIDALSKAIEKALSFSKQVMIERYVLGKELTCAVLDDGMSGVFPLPVTEIIPKGATFFDYDAKYTKGGSEEITPARISAEDTLRAQATAVRAHEALGASGTSRTDMILGEDGGLYVLELNTIPGMTETSLLPQAAIAHGMTLGELFDRIIEAAFIKHAAMARR